MHKKLYISVFFIALITLGFELVNIHFSSKLASDSVMVRQLQKNIAKLDEDNQILNSKVLQLTSFETIASRASEMGFVENHSYISLQNQAKLSYSK